MNEVQPVSVKLEHQDREHSHHSPSKLGKCPGFQDNPNSDKTAANRGSLGHECVEHNDLSRAGDDLKVRKGAEMCQAFRDKVVAKLGPGYETFAEPKLVHYPEEWGFADLCIVHPVNPHGVLMDWKFTYTFHSANGTQFKALAVGMFNRWPHLRTINAYVPHPYLETVDVHSYDRASYNELAAEIAALVAIRKSGDPSYYRPTSDCQYCVRAGKCPILRQIAMKSLERLGAVDLPVFASLNDESTPDQMAALLRLGPLLEAAAQGWRTHAAEAARMGAAIPGYVLGSKSGNMAITDAKATWGILNNEFPVAITLEEFLSVAKIDKSALENLVKEKAPARQKQKTADLLIARILDAGAASRPASISYLRASKGANQEPENK